ncbi:unnamed protein product [Rhodiola kirilowii]
MGRAPCCDKANVKKGPWSPEEDTKLKDYIEKNGTGGNWIALPQKAGLRRCGKSCRLRWLNYLRPNIKHGDFSEDEDRVICSLYATIGSRWSIIAAQLPGRTDNDIKNYWNTKLKKKLMAYAAASSTTACFSASSFQTSATKPLSVYSSAHSHLSSLCNYNYTPNPNTTSVQNSTKGLMDQPFSCHPVTSNNTATTTTSCLETSLSLFQTQMHNQQYYQPLMFVSTDQQTSCSSNNSDNGGSCGNKQDTGSIQNFNNNNSTNCVVVPTGFDEHHQYQNKSFMLNGYEESNIFLSQFDNMNSSSTGAAALMDFYDIEGSEKQLNMSISDLSLIHIGDNNQNHHPVMHNKIIMSQDQPMMKEKADQRMMMYFNSNYC